MPVSSSMISSSAPGVRRARSRIAAGMTTRPALSMVVLMASIYHPAAAQRPLAGTPLARRPASAVDIDGKSKDSVPTAISACPLTHTRIPRTDRRQYSSHGGSRMTVTHDVRDTWRSLARSPYFTIPVVLSLAFAIGVNVAAFSIINALVLRPLPVREPQQLFHITYAGETGSSENGNYP